VKVVTRADVSLGSVVSKPSTEQERSRDDGLNSPELVSGKDDRLGPREVPISVGPRVEYGENVLSYAVDSLAYNGRAMAEEVAERGNPQLDEVIGQSDEEEAELAPHEYYGYDPGGVKWAP
jgi:hypothetical protein